MLLLISGSSSIAKILILILNIFLQWLNKLILFLILISQWQAIRYSNSTSISLTASNTILTSTSNSSTTNSNYFNSDSNCFSAINLITIFLFSYTNRWASVKGGVLAHHSHRYYLSFLTGFLLLMAFTVKLWKQSQANMKNSTKHNISIFCYFIIFKTNILLSYWQPPYNFFSVHS